MTPGPANMSGAPNSHAGGVCRTTRSWGFSRWSRSHRRRPPQRTNPQAPDPREADDQDPPTPSTTEARPPATRVRCNLNSPPVNTGTTLAPSAPRRAPAAFPPETRTPVPNPSRPTGSAESVRGRPTTLPAAPPRPTPRPPPPPRASARQSGRRCVAPVREAAGWSSRRRNPPSRRRGGCGSPAVW